MLCVHISNCRIVLLLVDGGDTVHGESPRLVSSPTGDNLIGAHAWITCFVRVKLIIAI